jgi:hypothetical protein
MKALAPRGRPFHECALADIMVADCGALAWLLHERDLAVLRISS